MLLAKYANDTVKIEKTWVVTSKIYINIIHIFRFVHKYILVGSIIGNRLTAVPYISLLVT